MAAQKEPGAEEFGRKLKARREQLGLSRRDVVDATGLSYPYVSQLETGYRLPSHRALAALAEALEMSPNELSASIRYEEALASSDLGSPRKPRAARRRGDWYGNPRYVAAEPSAALSQPPPVPDPRRVAQQISELVGDLPADQRLDALSLAQRAVMDDLVAEQVKNRRERS
jgi:transcriptional regulator with XRE-family HTH domain